MDAQNQPEHVSMETQSSVQSEQIGKQDKENDEKTTVEQTKESPPEHGKEDTVEQGEENSQEHGTEDSIEQGKADSQSQSSENNTEQSKQDTVEHGMEPTGEGGKKETLEQERTDTKVGETVEAGKEDQGQKVMEQGQEVKVEENNKTERPGDRLDQVSDLDGGQNTMDLGTKGSEIIANEEAKVIESADISQSGDVPESCVLDDKDKIVMDDGPGEHVVERTTSEKPDGTPLAGAEQTSGGGKDMCVDNMEGDEKGAVGHTEPSVLVTKGDGICDDGDNDMSNVAKAEKLMVSQESDESKVSGDKCGAIANVAESGVIMETTRKVDGDGQTEQEIDKNDMVSVNASESSSGTSGTEEDDASSSGSDEEDVSDKVSEQESALTQAAEGEAQPGSSEELEMLELELRARAIRSLMKKMGKEWPIFVTIVFLFYIYVNTFILVLLQFIYIMLLQNREK